MSFNRVHFEDGNVYHDYHYNGMQENIDKEIKEQTVKSYYKNKLTFYNLNYCFIDPINSISYSDIDSIINMEYNSENLHYITEDIGEESSRYTSRKIELPEPSSEFVILSNCKTSEGVVVSHSLKLDNESKVIEEGKLIEFDSSTESVKLTINFYNLIKTDKPPILNDYCIMWK